MVPCCCTQHSYYYLDTNDRVLRPFSAIEQQVVTSASSQPNST